MSSQIGNPRRTPRNADRPRQRPAREDAVFVEDAVVGQLDLVAETRDGAIVEERDRIVDLTVLRPGGPDDDPRATVGGILGEGLDGGPAGVLESRLEDEVLGRIAGDEELGENQHVGAELRRFGARGPCLGEVAVDVADQGVELGNGDAESVGDVACHEGRFSAPPGVRQSGPPLSAGTLKWGGTTPTWRR